MNEEQLISHFTGLPRFIQSWNATKQDAVKRDFFIEVVNRTLGLGFEWYFTQTNSGDLRCQNGRVLCVLHLDLSGIRWFYPKGQHVPNGMGDKEIPQSQLAEFFADRKLKGFLNNNAEHGANPDILGRLPDNYRAPKTKA